MLYPHYCLLVIHKNMREYIDHSVSDTHFTKNYCTVVKNRIFRPRLPKFQSSLSSLREIINSPGVLIYLEGIKRCTRRLKECIKRCTTLWSLSPFSTPLPSSHSSPHATNILKEISSIFPSWGNPCMTL